MNVVVQYEDKQETPFNLCFKAFTMSDGIKLLDCVQVLQLLVALSSFLTLLPH